MFKKLLFALVLVLNHSLMFGVTEAAHIPDAQHPYGHTVSYDHEEESVDNTVIDIDDQGEHHHKHGMHVHLGCILPYSISFSIQSIPDQSLSSCKFLLQSLSYSPPVPPPNY